MNSIFVDTRLKSKIENMIDYENEVCSIKFKDLDDTFWFRNKVELQEFIRVQEVERFYEKELRKGYFLYTNEHNEVFKYIVESLRGKLNLIKEEFVECV